MSDKNWQIKPGQGWGPIQLGQPRGAVISQLSQAGVEVEDDDDPQWLYLSDVEAVLDFSNADPAILLQIECEDLEMQIGEREILGERLDQALLALEVARFEDTVWRLTNDEKDWLEGEDLADETESPPTSEELLTRGTLWVRSLGVGLMMKDGVVQQLLLRQLNDVPQIGSGPLTQDQLGLATYEQLADRLQLARRLSRRSARGCNSLRLIATLSLFAALGSLSYLAVKDQQRWHAAPRTPGTVVAIEDVPGQPVQYVIEYFDAQQSKHQTRCTLQDVFGSPKVGDPIEVSYLSEAPDTALGPVRVRDLAFEKYAPYFMGVFAAYFVALFFTR